MHNTVLKQLVQHDLLGQKLKFDYNINVIYLKLLVVIYVDKKYPLLILRRNLSTKNVNSLHEKKTEWHQWALICLWTSTWNWPLPLSHKWMAPYQQTGHYNRLFYTNVRSALSFWFPKVEPWLQHLFEVVKSAVHIVLTSQTSYMQT